MGLSNKTIPVLRPTKIQPPKPVLFGSLRVGGNAQALPAGTCAVDHRRDWFRPQAPLVEVGQSGDGPTRSEMASQRVIPSPPIQSQNTGFGAFALQAGPFVSSAQTAQAVPPLPPLFRPTHDQTHDIARSAVAPVALVDEWQDIEENDNAIADEEQMNTIGEPTSVVHESPLALTYHVEGASGVPSDGVPHQVTIAVLPFEAKIQHVTVPKVRPVAYLQATVKNTSDYRLLPGTVHAFVDDSFVSKTGIVGDVAPGDVFICTLGADPATRIQYARTSKRADDDAAGGTAGRGRSAFSEQWAATMYRSRTTVTNRHPFALRELVVRDGVPVCEDEKRVSVVLRHPAGLAELEQGKELEVDAKEDGGQEGDGDGDGEGQGQGKKQRVQWCKVVDGKGGRKEGLFEWVVEVGAGEELTIETEWDVKAPVSLKWIEST
jgi:uncharacterized protein (TIGR02231 family)